MRLVWLNLDNHQGSILIDPEIVERIEEGPPDEFCFVYVRGRRKPYEVAGNLLSIGQQLETGKFDRFNGVWCYRAYLDPRRSFSLEEPPPRPKMVPAMIRLVPDEPEGAA